MKLEQKVVSREASVRPTAIFALVSADGAGARCRLLSAGASVRRVVHTAGSGNGLHRGRKEREKQARSSSALGPRTQLLLLGKTKRPAVARSGESDAGKLGWSQWEVVMDGGRPATMIACGIGADDFML